MNRILGAFFESVALNYFIKRDYNLVCRNFHSPYSEIDLVLRKTGKIYFVEVKYRDSAIFGKAGAAVTQNKIRKLRMAIASFLARTRFLGDYQLDVLAISRQERHIIFEHIEDVFSP